MGIQGEEALSTVEPSSTLSDQNHGENIATLTNVPVLGQKFKSKGEAYDFYNLYARSVGFCIRRHWKCNSKKDKTLLWRIFCCSSQGEREKHPKGTPTKQRAQSRFNCKAELKIELDKCSEDFVVTNFVEQHNHELAHPSSAHMMRSHRRVPPAQKGLIYNMASAGIGSSEIYYHMCKESGGYENINILQMDCDNIVQRKRIEFLKKGDGQLLYEYFMQKEKNNKSFCFEIQMDDNNQIQNCFWCNAKSRMDYQSFGDVVCFDTTYKTNDYDMPFAPIVGVNNYGQTVIFGSALLNDETTETFEWVFKMFLKAMGGKKMETIFTDQALAIVKAIKLVLPDTHHRLCIWHIYQNALRNLSHVFSEFESFGKDFKKCIYEAETENEFLSHWDELLEEYKLDKNDWMNSLFQLREKWAQVYAHDHFCAGMASTQSESMNNYFKKYFKRKQILREFMEQFDKAISLRRQKEANADLKSKTTTPILVSQWRVERHASEFYTRKMFNRFQDEVKAVFDLEAKLVDDNNGVCRYEISSYNGARTRSVELVFPDYMVKCSCKKFEFSGILCSHALKVLRMQNISKLPSHYLLKRWSKEGSPDIIIDPCGNILEADTNPALSLHYSEISRMAQFVVVKGAITEEQTLVAISGLKRVLDELNARSDPLQDNNIPSASIQDEDPSSVVKQGVAEYSCANITLLAPPRKNHKGEDPVRKKAFYDKMKKSSKTKPQKKKKVAGTNRTKAQQKEIDSSMQLNDVPRPSSYNYVSQVGGLHSRADLNNQGGSSMQVGRDSWMPGPTKNSMDGALLQQVMSITPPLPGQMGLGSQPSQQSQLTEEMEQVLQQVMSITPEQIQQVLQLQQMMR